MNMHRDHCAESLVVAELNRILGSPDFDASERNRRFLRHVVEETLAGRADRIKAYSIATIVFGRSDSFDPQLDSIVRIEAGRLRRSLERYYLTEGRHDRLRITIPKGTYIPAFEERDAVPAAPDAAPRARPAGERRHGPAILVAPFEVEGEAAAAVNLGRGFTRALVVALTRFSNLFVLGPEETPPRAPGQDDTPPAGGAGADYVLSGAVSVGEGSFVVEVLLVDALSHECVWADRIERRLSPCAIGDARNEVADRVASLIAQPYGVIFCRKAREVEHAPLAALSGYASVLLFYQFWRRYDPALTATVRAALERAVRAEPDYAEALACLSLLHLDAYRYGFSIGEVDGHPLEQALGLARRAVDLEPNASYCHYALGLALWLLEDVKSALAAFETGLALNPNDTRLMAELGMRHALLGRWETAMPLIEEAFRRNPALPAGHRIGVFLYHFAHGRYEDALTEARTNRSSDVIVHWNVAEAAAAAMIGRQAEAEAAVQRILGHWPDYGAEVREDLRKRSLHPDLIDGLIAGLRKAGLPGIAPEPQPCAGAGATLFLRAGAS